MSEKKIPMRQVMADWLDARMAGDDRIVVLNADLGGACGTQGLAKKFPERVFNVGIAEANMAGVAAGLAAYGYKPYIFSFGPFVTRRIADQAAISISYAGLKVVIVGTDPGIGATMNGGTHMPVEDAAIMRAIPGYLVYEPGDNAQYVKALPELDAYPGPVYIRQARKMTPAEFTPLNEFSLLGADLLREGTDVTLICAGLEIEPAMQAVEALAQKGVSAEVLGIHTIKPLDIDGVRKSVEKTGCAVVCENHSVVGGLGGAVAEGLARTCPTPLEFIGFQDCFGGVGKLEDLRAYFHMTAEDIAQAAETAMARK